MVLFADNKYRYSLQWDAFSEEQIRARFRAAILGFSVNFVHKKRLAERYQ